MNPTDRFVALTMDEDFRTIRKCHETLRDMGRVIRKAQLSECFLDGESHGIQCHVTRYKAQSNWRSSERPLVVEAVVTKGEHRPTVRINIVDPKGPHKTTILAMVRLDQANLIQPEAPTEKLIDFIEDFYASTRTSISPFAIETPEEPVVLGTMTDDVINDIAAIIHANPGLLTIGRDDFFSLVLAKPFAPLQFYRFDPEVSPNFLAPELAMLLNDKLPEVVTIAVQKTSRMHGFSLGPMTFNPFRMPEPENAIEAMKRLTRFAHLTRDQLWIAEPQSLAA